MLDWNVLLFCELSLWQQQSFKKAFNFMQSLIDNPNQQILDTSDNSDKSDMDLDIEPLNQD